MLSHALTIGFISGSQKGHAIVLVLETLADFYFSLWEKRARTSIKQKRKSTPWFNKPRQSLGVVSYLPLISWRWSFCESSPVRGEAEVAVFILEASRPSRLTPIMLMISRDLWARKTKTILLTYKSSLLELNPRAHVLSKYGLLTGLGWLGPHGARG